MSENSKRTKDEETVEISPETESAANNNNEVSTRVVAVPGVDVAEQIVKQINGDPDTPPQVPEEISLLPLRDTVIFPVLVAPIAVGREGSVKLVDDAVAAGNRIIGVVA